MKVQNDIMLCKKATICFEKMIYMKEYASQKVTLYKTGESLNPRRREYSQKSDFV